ncbi:polysaccharide biosynthesis protein [Eisenbergiella tayi]|uniref:Putative cell division protein YtgP n=1 Tax=Eisenbergiella tayi TaxID=1432052 RepID=A0A1E3AY11_9FIRM|nr:polysaccharide biosynthesis protein [Eisenbergiella tayi]ODM13549.1 putative cell division protein YtgP [Eisenbergiella tayi]OIZ66192.1 polysaccharide biosynthesis protein [Eisenbergiella tayi]
MGKKKNSNNFVMQAGILAAAGIICRIIGILYRSPLAAVIGDEGNGYYSSAYEIYTIILLVSSYSIPSAISKVIAQRLALKEYRNAQKIFRCAIGYVVVVGGLASLFTFFGAGLLVGGNSIPVLRIFAPTIFFSGLLGVLRGYFQAHGTMVPTSFSQIVEQILNAVVSILAAFLLIKAVSDSDTTTQAVYGASGSAIGTGSGVIIALLFMLGVFLLNKEYINRKVKRDNSSQVLSTGEVYKIIITMVTPVILSTFIYNFNTSLNLTIYTRIMEHVKGFTEAEAYTQYGLFSGKAKQISNIPIAIASAMSSAMIPGISGSFAQGDIAGTNRRIGTAIKTTMFLSIPSAVGLTVLAKPVTLLLYPQKASVDTVSYLLAAMSISIIFYALSTISNAVLQGIGKVNLPVVNAAVALVIQTVVLVPLLLTTDLGLYTLVIATVLYSFLMCILNGISVKKELKYKQEIIKTFLLPGWAAILMGVAAFGVYHGLYLLIHMNVVCLAAAILVAVPIYFVLTIKMGAVGRKDLLALPKGTLFVRVAEKCRLIH